MRYLYLYLYIYIYALGISRDLRGDLHVDYAKEAIAQEVCLALALALTLTLTMLPSNGGGPSP